MLNNKKYLYKLVTYNNNTKYLYKCPVIRENKNYIYFKKHERSRDIFIIRTNELDVKTLVSAADSNIKESNVIYSFNKNTCFNKSLKTKIFHI